MNDAQKNSAKPPKRHGIAHLIAATRYSFYGLSAAFRGETAFRHDLLLVVVSTILAFCLRLSLAERLVVIGLGCGLLTTELLNSGLEAIVDLVSPEFHPLAKRAKDMGSAAVFCMLVAIGIAWIMILCSKFLEGGC